jgi:transposase-like protein
MVYENDEKKHCPKCKSKQVKLFGKTKQGKQRYQCLDCKRTYVWKQNKSIEQRRYRWFKEWILGGLTIKQIANINKVSSSTVRRVIGYWLEKEPPKLKGLEEVKYVILDGTYINHRTGIYVVMDGKTHKVIYGDYGISETGKHLKGFYEYLQREGLNPISATIDGSLQQLKYLTEAWESLIIQRCLVHIQRQGLSWLRQKPKRIDAIKLRELLLQVLYIKNKEQSERFIKGFKIWEDRFGLEVRRSTNRGKVFSDLIRTRSMIINALPNMFNYLDKPEISRTTNPLEGYFGRLKHKYRTHKGLSKHKRKNYFGWYFYLKPI